jgi:hypothetical protein
VRDQHEPELPQDELIFFNVRGFRPRSRGGVASPGLLPQEELPLSQVVASSRRSEEEDGCARSTSSSRSWKIWKNGSPSPRQGETNTFSLAIHPGSRDPSSRRATVGHRALRGIQSAGVHCVEVRCGRDGASSGPKEADHDRDLAGKKIQTAKLVTSVHLDQPRCRARAAGRRSVNESRILNQIARRTGSISRVGFDNSERVAHRRFCDLQTGLTVVRGAE